MCTPQGPIHFTSEEFLDKKVIKVTIRVTMLGNLSATSVTSGELVMYNHATGSARNKVNKEMDGLNGSGV